MQCNGGMHPITDENDDHIILSAGVSMLDTDVFKQEEKVKHACNIQKRLTT